MKIIQMKFGADQLGAVATLLHAQWKEDYPFVEAAAASVCMRLSDPGATVIVAIDSDGTVAGTGTVALRKSMYHQDRYSTFLEENGVFPCEVGRDIAVHEAYRGRRFGPLKVWELLLLDMLAWLADRDVKKMAVFVDGRGPLDLVGMNAKRGAVVVRHLDHRSLGARSVVMMEYPVQVALETLRQR
jgi:hypothetical protein